ncbi:hypothetical protein ACFFHH_13665 [Cytobacillus solani]|uniref:hypothetical protein n=1 Tax=Cytobacillus solani TaxID=1637975 RepID=UPI00114DB38E|nr:hypothetical protein [Cytobacillus solani]
MKKKAIKIAASTAVAASAFVAAAPVNKADAAVNVDQLVKSAEASAKVLQWSISTEGTANFVDRPYAQYNAAKKTNAAAKAAIAKLSASEKVVYEARLLDSDIQIKRAQAYIDALTSGEKIRDKQAALDKAIKAADLKSVQSSYHVLTAEIRKQAELLYRVYGQSTRDGILKTFKAPAESLYRSVVNEVTVLDHTALVDKYTKEKNFDKAVDHVAKAEYALKDVKLFKTELTKNLNDVVDALPLDVVSVSRVDSTTVQVKFTKALDVAPVAHFTFDKGLIVSSTKLSDDKRTVTLTVSGEKANETYTLSYKGEAKKSYTSPKDNTTGPIVGPKETARVDAGKYREYTFNIKNTDGRPYTHDVKVKILDANDTAAAAGVLKSVNGNTNLAPDTDGSVTVKPSAEGKVTVIITSVDATTGGTFYPEITKTTTGDVETGGKTIFLVDDVADTTTTGANNVVDYVDATNDFFAIDTNKFTFKKTDILQVKGITVSYDEFKKALTAYSKVAVSYNPKTTNIFNITEPLTVSVIKVTNPSNGESARVKSAEYFDLRGAGQAGKEVRVFAADGTTLVDKATVGSNGVWEVRVYPKNKDLTKYVVEQYEGSSDTSAPTAGAKKTVKIYAGSFDVIDVKNETNTGALAVNEELTFTFSSYGTGNDEYKDSAVVANNTALTFTDDNFKTITFTVGSGGTQIVKNNANQVKVKLGNPTKVDSGFDSAKTPKLTQMTNVKSKDGISLSLSSSLDIK